MPPKFFISAQLRLATIELATPHGMTFATRMFGEEALSSLPKYSRGPKAGKPKGYLHYRFATSPGWYPEAGRALQLNDTAQAWIGETFLSLIDQAPWGTWLGKHQPLASKDGVYLKEEGRALWAAEQEALQAARAA